MHCLINHFREVRLHNERINELVVVCESRESRACLRRLCGPDRPRQQFSTFISFNRSSGASLEPDILLAPCETRPQWVKYLTLITECLRNLTGFGGPSKLHAHPRKPKNLEGWEFKFVLPLIAIIVCCTHFKKSMDSSKPASGASANCKRGFRADSATLRMLARQ